MTQTLITTTTDTRTTTLARTLVCLAVLLGGSLAISCGGDSAAPSDNDAQVEAASPEPQPAVEYVPAYPEEVSSEGLSSDDVEQQESVGAGEEHSHGADGHSHGEDEEHDDHEH